MGDEAVRDMCNGTRESGKLYLHGVSPTENGRQEIERTMKIILKLDLDLEYSSEKLVNLHILLMYLLAQENDLQAMVLENNSISTDSIENLLTFDLLSGILDAELRELKSFKDNLLAEIVDARLEIFSCRHLRELSTKMEENLQDSEKSLRQSQAQILELKEQLAKFQRTIFGFKFENGQIGMGLELSEDGQVSNINAKSNMKITGEHRHLLRMLEKSLARELDLEKTLAKSRQSEKELEVKLHYTEQVAFHMEEAAEVVWGRFLEAENAAEVLMDISKDMVGRVQLVQFNQNGSIQREIEMNTKLQDCIEQLKEKDVALERIERSNVEHIDQSAEVFSLREKMNLLEEMLKESQIQLINANACNEASQEQLSEMEIVIESLKENMYVAESRAESAEAKAAQLTETNLELTEELNFHKGSASNTDQKVGLLEKQMREFEIQLQHAKASSEASQEQQNMLYSAIWDMETLIEDLKSKVAKAESKTETAEEQCILLSETNLELNNEISSLRARTEFLEMSLDQANNAKLESAKEINTGTKFIMDMAVQLATERERIQKQLNKLTKENNILIEKLWHTKIMNSNVNGDSKELLFSKNDQINSTCTKKAVPGSLDKSLQVDKSSGEEPISDSEVKSSVSENNVDAMVSEHEAVKVVEARCSHQTCVFAAIFVLILSASATYLFSQNSFFNFDGKCFQLP